MKTIEISLYSIKELSEQAQQTAIENYRNDNDFDYITQEAGKTLDIFCKIFNIDYRQFDFCEFHRSSYSLNMEDNILELSGQRLAYSYRALTPHICGCSCNQEIKKGEEYYQVFSIDGIRRHFVAYVKAECFSEYKIRPSMGGK